MSQLQTSSTRKCTSIDDVVHNSSQISKMGKKKVAGVSHTNAKKVAEKIAKHDELAALNDRLLAGWSGHPGLLGIIISMHVCFATRDQISTKKGTNLN